MRIFKNRPLALAACLLSLTAVLSFRLSAAQKGVAILVAALLLALAVSGLLFWKKARQALLCGLCLCGILLGLASSFCFFDLRYAAIQERNGTATVAEGTVLERKNSTAFSSMLHVRLTEFDGERVDFDAVVEFGYATALQAGDRFCMTVTPRAFTQDELFDEETFRLSDGCMTVLVCAAESDCEILPEEDRGLLVSLRRLNTKLAYELSSRIGGEAGGLAAAFLLGNRSFLTSNTSLQFRRAGVSHLLALSGMHVSILIFGLELLLRKLRLPKLARAILIPIAALGYMALTGFSLSICRAVLMVCVLYLAYLLQAHYDAFTALCLVLAAFLVVTPYAVLDLSMWLSFLAAAGIIVFAPLGEELSKAARARLPLPDWLFSAIEHLMLAVLVGLAANMAILLLSAVVFGEISLASIPSTLLLSLPVTVLMIASVPLLLIPSLPLLPLLCSWLGNGILRVTAAFSSIHGALLPVGDIPTQACLAVLTLVLVLLAVLSVKRKRWFFLPLLLAFCAVCSSLSVTHLPRADAFSETVIASSLGEVRLYTQNGEAILVHDARQNFSMAYEIQAAAREHRCSEIGDLVVLTYRNQTTYFLSCLSGRIRVERLHLSEPRNARERAIAARYEQEAALHGIAVFYDGESFLEKVF